MTRSKIRPALSHAVGAATLRRLGTGAAVVACALVGPTTSAAAERLGVPAASVTTEVRPLATQIGDEENNFS